MAAPVVVDRTSGELNGFTPDNFVFPDYSAGDLVVIFYAEGQGDLFMAQQSNIGLWSHFRQSRFTTASMGIIFKFMDGTEGASLDTILGLSGSNNPPKSYIAVSISGADPYRGLAIETVLADFNESWPSSTSCDPPELASPFEAAEELLWFALGCADAGVVGSEGGMTAGPTGDFSFVNYYLPAGESPAQPRAMNHGYAELTSDASSWDPEAWTLPLSEETCAWTLALPPARQHRHPDLIQTEYFKTGTMGSPQTVSITVPTHTNGLLTIYVCGGAGCTLVLDPSGAATVPSLGPSEPGTSGETLGAQMFYCGAPAPGNYDLQLTKVGTSNNARLVTVCAFDNVDEVVDWGSVTSNSSSHTVNLDTEDDHVAVVGFSDGAGGAGEEGLPCDLMNVAVDGVPMAPKASAMTLVADVTSGANTTIRCRSFVGRTSGGTQSFVGSHMGGTTAPRRLLVMYLRGLDDMNAPWWGTEF